MTAAKCLSSLCRGVHPPFHASNRKMSKRKISKEQFCLPFKRCKFLTKEAPASPRKREIALRPIQGNFEVSKGSLGQRPVDLSDIYNVERMSQMISSPSVLSKTLRVKAKRSDFSWSMEQLSTIQPADINESGNSSNAWSCSTAQESAVQEAIDEFFSDNLIHPSPRLQRSPSDSTPSLSPVQMNNDGIGRSVQCQTLFTFPRNLNFDMFLGEHFRLSDESASSVSNQTMGCRKKLFEQSDSSQFEKSSGSVVDEDVADVAVCIGDLKMSTTESFSSVPSGKCGTDENCVQPLYLSPNETSEAKNKLPSDHIATECFIPIELIDSGNVSAVSSDSPTMSMTELSGSKSQSIQKNEDSGMSSCRGTQFEENMQANASLKYNASA
ncbi:hypothetical protein D918_09150 [Trichuris suis]|nr:hypothetical protein D918_09150 [Trichuris suis]